MAKIKVPSDVRRAAVDRVDVAINEVIEAHERELTAALAASPWPADVAPCLDDRERARWLLLREVQKAIQQRRLRQDGPRRRLVAAALGKPCPRSKMPMATRNDIELEHDEYDGRPPIAVHRGWHRKTQPH